MGDGIEITIDTPEEETKTGENLTKRQAEALVSYWKPKIEAGKKYKDRFGKPKEWEKYRKYYRGDWDSNTLPVNKVFSHGKSLVPRLYFKDPTITITAARPELEWHARIVEQVDNYLIRETGLKLQIKRACLDAYLCGIGIIKLGYDSEYGYIPDLAAAEDGETATQLSTKEENTVIEYRENIKPGMPWGIRVTPDDIITPWGYSTPESLPWITHRIIRPLEDVQADQKYPAEITKKLKGGFTSWKEKSRSVYWDSNEEQFCELYEIRDVKHKRIIVMCEGEILLSQPDEVQIDGLPYVFIILNEDPDHFWPIPEVKIIEPQQLELNEIRTQASRHRRLALMKLLVAKGAISADDLSKVNNEEILPIIEVKGDGGLQNIVLPIQAAHVPPELWREEETVKSDIRDTVGESPNRGGGFMAPGGSTPPTASEVMKVDAGAEIRTDEKRDQVADALVTILRKWNQIIFKFWTGKRVSRIIGPDGLEKWIKYSGDQLKGEYFLKIDPDSALPVTRSLRFSQAKELYMMFNGDPMVDQLMLRKLMLRQTEWIDPAWTLVIPHTNQSIPMEVLAFLKQSGINLLSGGSSAQTIYSQMPGKQLEAPGLQGGEATALENLPKPNAPLPL